MSLKALPVTRERSKNQQGGQMWPPPHTPGDTYIPNLKI